MNMVRCQHCKKEHFRDDSKHHEEQCLEFYKFKTKQLEKEATKLHEQVATLTAQTIWGNLRERVGMNEIIKETDQNIFLMTPFLGGSDKIIF